MGNWVINRIKISVTENQTEFALSRHGDEGIVWFIPDSTSLKPDKLLSLAIISDKNS